MNNKENNNETEVKKSKKIIIKGKPEKKRVKPDPTVIKKKDPVIVKEEGATPSNYIVTQEEVENIKTNSRKTVKRKRKRKLDYKDLEILGALFVLIELLTWKFLGMLFAIIMAIGLVLIIGGAFLIKIIPSKGKGRVLFNVFAIIFLLLCILGALSIGGFMIYIATSAPEFEPTKLYSQQSSIIYDSKGVEMVKIGSEVRELVTYDDLPQVFVDALIATEDANFFQHNGVDIKRFAVATAYQLLGKNKGGASTLSMQVVKNTYTDASSTSGLDGIIRKFTDIYLAVFKLEKNYSKEEIIEFYVNSQCLSGTVCGIEQAAQTFFGKSIRDVNLAEASLLAGMYKAPTSYNPYSRPNAAQTRRATVLELMERHGYITSTEKNLANSMPVPALLSNSASGVSVYQGYIDTVLEELADKYNINPYKVSVEVYTNMDRDKQDGINKVLSGETFKWKDEFVQTGAVAIDHYTGKIVAIAAGRNRTGILSYNFATQAQRQIGSTAKPIFDYGPAIEYLGWMPATMIHDEPWAYSSGQEVRNSDRSYNGWISLRTSLKNSRNVPAVKAFQTVSKNVGNSYIYKFASSLGIKPETSNGSTYTHEAHALGAFSGATPLQMAGAYQAFANGGYYIEPYSVSKIVYRDTGEVINVNKEKVQVMTPETAFLITDVLKDAVNTGLSGGAKINGINIAAKTGTTNFYETTINYYGLKGSPINDLWIVGYDPDYTLSMWYGYDKISKDHYNQNKDVTVRGNLYRALASCIFSRTGKDFVAPEGVIYTSYEKDSDPFLLPSSNTPEDQIAYDWFKVGYEPTEVSSKFVSLDAPSNLKATYADGKVSLVWNSVTPVTGSQSYGRFGYRVYLDDTEIGFTTDNTYQITTDDPDGTYYVATSFEFFTGNISGAISYRLKTNGTIEYKVELKSDKASVTCEEGTTPCYTDGVTVLEDGSDITKQTTIKTTYSYTDPDGKTIAKDSFDGSVGTWEITYTADLRKKTVGSAKLKVKVTKKVEEENEENE